VLRSGPQLLRSALPPSPLPLLPQGPSLPSQLLCPGLLRAELLRSGPQLRLRRLSRQLPEIGLFGPDRIQKTVGILPAVFFCAQRAPSKATFGWRASRIRGRLGRLPKLSAETPFQEKLTKS
jgi:hypothetical protein